MPQSPGRRRFMGTMSLASLGGLAGPPPAVGAAAPTSVQEQGGPAQPSTGVTRALARYVVGRHLCRHPGGRQEGSAAHAAQLDRLRRGRLPPRDAGCRHRRAGAVLRPAAGVGARPARADGHAARGADERHQLARLRLRRHAPEDGDPSGGAGRLGAAGAGRTPPACRAPISSTPWCSASRWSAASATRCIPPHYDRGWHITGTAGVFGAAAACGKALGLSEQQMVWALGLAATQPVGLREMFGIDDQELPSRPRRAERPDRGAPGRRATSPAPRSASKARAAGPTSSAPPATTPQITGQPRQELRDRAQHLQAVRLRHRHSSDDRCLHPAAATSTS